LTLLVQSVQRNLSHMDP